MIEFERGQLYFTNFFKDGACTYNLRPGFKAAFILLECLKEDEDFEYSENHAVDSLNSLGWVTFDDVSHFFGEEKTLELIEFCEQRNKKFLDNP